MSPRVIGIDDPAAPREQGQGAEMTNHPNRSSSAKAACAYVASMAGVERVRIKAGEVHAYGRMPNSSITGWYLAGYVAELAARWEGQDRDKMMQIHHHVARANLGETDDAYAQRYLALLGAAIREEYPDAHVRVDLLSGFANRSETIVCGTERWFEPEIEQNVQEIANLVWAHM